MDPSVLANMDKDALKKQIENMKYQVEMDRWPLSKSIVAERRDEYFDYLYFLVFGFSYKETSVNESLMRASRLL
ncbi:Guanine nucleotide-binding protein subunit gamma-e [Apis cerana cerana]|uniref:Guanine nucleotide-binding protein subunit gamma-e n=1 Tax=Apis cerana cerana TaxID=94128 RepID=A0A2A3EPH2_APICC|nr:Guanine nucleotide-binding protein subunit gamma-e [Apis cerana cerana]